MRVVFYSLFCLFVLLCIFQHLCGHILVYTKFILVRLWRKLPAYRKTLESVPGTNQYWAISVKFFAQGNNGLSLTGFEPMQLAILRLLVRRINHSTMPPHLFIFIIILFIRHCSFTFITFILLILVSSVRVEETIVCLGKETYIFINFNFQRCTHVNYPQRCIMPLWSGRKRESKVLYFLWSTYESVESF